MTKQQLLIYTTAANSGEQQLLQPLLYTESTEKQATKFKIIGKPTQLYDKQKPSP